MKYTIICLILLGCGNVIEDSHNSEKLTSSRGETIYINSLNWGVTGDYQMTCISSNPKKLRDRTDTLDVVRGLHPFIYSFQNDSLKLFFIEKVNYQVKEQFKTINISYQTLTSSEYNDMVEKAVKNDGLHLVPSFAHVSDPPDMPKPPSR